jgi:hypothetical protein
MPFLNRAFCLTLFITARVFAAREIVRLSPVSGPSHVPSACRIVSVLKESPAEKAGISVGDVLQSLNGQTPTDAAGFSALVAAAPEDSELKILKPKGVVRSVKVKLKSGHPRLGAVCDLEGWARPGVTAAGNESVTVFGGPFALTASGILDKGFAFLRVRVANDSDHAVQIGPSLFIAADGGGYPMPVLSPRQVICLMYGEKGAHLLALKKKRRETLDAHGGNLPSSDSPAEERCNDAPAKGATLHHADSEFAEANAAYLSEQSLWTATLPPGQVADGLIYFEEPSSLPLILKATVEGRAFALRLGMPVAGDKTMKRSELRKFFEAQKKGTSIRLTLKKGTVAVGRFTGYDSVEERAWFDTPYGSLLNATSYSLDSLRSAESLDKIPARPGPDTDHLN